MRVAIVGAGLSGLATLKECLAQGIEADVFDTLPHLGGAWAYCEPDPETGEVMSSMYQGVMLNSCRDTSCFSDFPLDPARYPDYFGHRMHLRYMQEYADFFGLRPHLRLRTTVVRCTHRDADGKWLVTYRQHDASVDSEDEYDAVFACSGHLSIPYVPEFQGKELFTGESLHSHLYRTPGRFEGKRVAIIGIGSSAVDIASEIGPQASSLHVITRRGGWVVPRFVLGKPAEAWDNRFQQTVLPKSFNDWSQRLILNAVEGKHPKAIQPTHQISEANVTVRSDFLEKIRTGVITPIRAGIERITEKGLVTTNGEDIEFDVIIYCTGYKIEFPYLPTETYRSEQSKYLDFNNSVNLYNLMVPVDHHNLFFIGLLELNGPLAPACEAQARWCAAVLSGNIKQPSREEMVKSIELFKAEQAKHFVNSDRHSVTTTIVSYCDNILRPLGAVPSFSKLLGNIFTSGKPFQALSLLNSVYMGVTAPAQYRIFGEGSCPTLAKETVLRTTGGKPELSKLEVSELEKARKFKDVYEEV